MKANKFLFLVLLILMSSPNVAHAQFWQGFLYGVGQAAQNYNNQRQNSNRRSSDYYANKYGNGSSNSRTTEPEVTKTRKVEDDGFVWYRLRRSGGTYGIENANGDVVLYPDYGSINYDKESKNFDVKCESGCHEGVLSKSGSWIIPLDREYESLYYSDLFDRYVVEKNGFKGICSTDGKEIIAPSKYSSIHLYEGIYYVEKDGYEGACDANGKEIIAPNSYKDILFLSGEFKYKNDDGDWISLNIDKYGNRISTSTGSSVASNSNVTMSTSVSRKKNTDQMELRDLPFTMAYCLDGRTQNIETREIHHQSPAIGYITFYEDKIIIDNIDTYTLWQEQGGVKAFQGKTWSSNGVSATPVIFCDKYFKDVVLFISNSVVTLKAPIHLMEVSDFQSLYNQHSGINNGLFIENSYNSNGISSYDTDSGTKSYYDNRYGYKDCTHCHNSGKCNTCNGKGWFYPAASSTSTDCPNCTDGKCTWCGGTGKRFGSK